jgi:hypothetical protein
VHEVVQLPGWRQRAPGGPDGLPEPADERGLHAEGFLPVGASAGASERQFFFDALFVVFFATFPVLRVLPASVSRYRST